MGISCLKGTSGFHLKVLLTALGKNSSQILFTRVVYFLPSFLVSFQFSFSGACQHLEAEWEQIVKTIRNEENQNLKTAELNCQINTKACTQGYSIESLPTISLFQNGKGRKPSPFDQFVSDLCFSSCSSGISFFFRFLIFFPQLPQYIFNPFFQNLDTKEKEQAMQLSIGQKKLLPRTILLRVGCNNYLNN